MFHNVNRQKLAAAGSDDTAVVINSLLGEIENF